VQENYHKSIIFCSNLLTAVLRVVSCKVWFGLRLLMRIYIPK